MSRKCAISKGGDCFLKCFPDDANLTEKEVAECLKCIFERAKKTNFDHVNFDAVAGSCYQIMCIAFNAKDQDGFVERVVCLLEDQVASSEALELCRDIAGLFFKLVQLVRKNQAGIIIP